MWARIDFATRLRSFVLVQLHSFEAEVNTKQTRFLEITQNVTLKLSYTHMKRPYFVEVCTY